MGGCGEGGDKRRAAERTKPPQVEAVVMVGSARVATGRVVGVRAEARRAEATAAGERVAVGSAGTARAGFAGEV